MGAFQSLFTSLFGKKPMRLLLVGPPGAGKSTMMHKVQLGGMMQPTTIGGVTVETLDYKNISFMSWDYGGEDMRSVYDTTRGIILMVDAADPLSIDKAAQQLQEILNDDLLKDAAILVLANKQDIPGAAIPRMVEEKLGLHRVRDRQWVTQSACAESGDGLYEGVDWLAGVLERMRD